MKLKSVFRSKSSLETEMKRALENSNATLTAFVINNFEYRKIPHSAFHSLEYTHMRTIISQLNDNSWFKTFSDLTDCEHDTLNAIVGKHYDDGEMVNRELVALKVLRKNRVNAWVRLVEYALRAHNFLPQFDNYRIVLAILREKKDTIGLKKRIPVRRVISSSDDEEETLQSPPVPMSIFDDNAQRLSEITMPVERGMGRRPPVSRFPPPPPPPPPGFPPHPRPGAGFPPPPRPYQGRNPRPFMPTPEVTEVTMNNFEGKNLSKNAVLKALTTYTSFTLRKAPPLTTHVGAGHMFYPSEVPWMRCLVTKEMTSTPDLKRRVAEFVATGLSVIDMKFELTDMQSSHLTILFNEFAADETDPHFEHTLVELSLINREKGILGHQQGSPAEIVHVIVRRAPKEGTDVVELYKKLMSRPEPPSLRGINGDFGPHPVPIVVHPIKRRKSRFKKASVIRESSDSDSTHSIASSYLNRSDDDSDSEAEVTKVTRWKRNEDPAEVRFGKKAKGQDVVQCLLDLWTVDSREEKECK